jgi:hypothetical protein
MNAAPRTPVIGVVGRDVPIELIEAHGATVRRLELHPGSDVAEATEILGTGIDPAATAVLAGVLETDAAPLDAIVLCSDSDATQRLFFGLRELARMEPERALPPIHLVDIVHLPRASSLEYSRGEVDRLAARLRAWTGSAPSARDLARAVRERDLVRLLLAEVRRRVDGAAFFAWRSSVDEMPAAVAVERLRAVLVADPAPLLESLPVALTGSSQYGSEVVAAIEACGARVVVDDCAGGSLGLGIGAREPSLDGLAERYWRDGDSAHRGSAPERASRLAITAEREGARAIVSYARRRDDAASWEVAAVRSATSLPVIVLHDQEFGGVDRSFLRDALDQKGGAHV